jgi:hypothetical protein
MTHFDVNSLNAANRLAEVKVKVALFALFPNRLASSLANVATRSTRTPRARALKGAIFVIVVVVLSVPLPSSSSRNPSVARKTLR